MGQHRADDKKHNDEPLRAHYKKMSETPIPQLVTRLAFPAILSLLITSIYNIADTFFVSQLGTSAAGAVGVVFSLMAIFQAIGFALGVGAGNLLARQLGEMDSNAASRNASTAFFAAFAVGILFAVFGQVFMEELMLLLGSTRTILPYALAYGRYILLAAPFMCSAFVMNCLLRCEGKSTLATIGISVGGLLNIALDPVLIYTFHMGTAGAALATALSQLVSFFILLSFFLTKKSNLRLSITLVSKSPMDYGRIIFSGMPSLSRQGLASISTLLLNRAAAMYGDPAVAAMGIISKVFAFVFSAIQGFLQGYQPVVAFNYGAKKFDRVKKSTYFSAAVVVSVVVGIAAVCYVAAPNIIAVFRRDDAEVIAIGTLAFRLQCLVMPVVTISTVANYALQSTGQGVRALILASCRQGIFFIPLVLILPMCFGLLGVQITQPISDMCTLVVSIPFLIHFLQKVSQLERQEEQRVSLAKNGDRKNVAEERE